MVLTGLLYSRPFRPELVKNANRATYQKTASRIPIGSMLQSLSVKDFLSQLQVSPFFHLTSNDNVL